MYNEEVVDMNLVSSHELCFDGNGYIRQIASGFLKIKFDRQINQFRPTDWIDNFEDGRKGNRQIEMRLCGKKGFDLHDICYLYIEYDVDGKSDKVEIPDLRSKEEFEAIAKYEDRMCHEFAPYFLGGFAEKIDKDTILITFGKTALADERCQKELKRLSIFNLEKD